MYKIKKKSTENINASINWGNRDTLWTGGVIILILVIVILLKVIPEKSFEKKTNSYTGETEAIVLAYKANKYNSQNFEGGQIKVISYTIDYEYKVESTFYSGSSTIPNQGKYYAFTNSLYKGQSVRVKYDKKNITDSEIVIE